jgi:transposase InsO family protein
VVSIRVVSCRILSSAEVVVGEALRTRTATPSITSAARFIVGWALSAVNDRHLTLRALDMAVKRRCQDPGCSITPTRAAPTPAKSIGRALEQHGITCSMSRRGNCCDNAVIESWFSTVKSEEGERFESYAHAKEALFDYIEVFYNYRPPHSTLGQISPAAFERRTRHAA